VRTRGRDRAAGIVNAYYAMIHQGLFAVGGISVGGRPSLGMALSWHVWSLNLRHIVPRMWSACNTSVEMISVISHRYLTDTLNCSEL
jgi:hypothetical protein